MNGPPNMTVRLRRLTNDERNGGGGVKRRVVRLGGKPTIDIDDGTGHV